MYSCYNHGWTSHFGPCPSCQMFTTSVDTSTEIFLGEVVGLTKQPKEEQAQKRAEEEGKKTCHMTLDLLNFKRGYMAGFHDSQEKIEWPDPKDLKEGKYQLTEYDEGWRVGILKQRKEVLTALHSGGVEALRELVKGWMK